MKSFHGHCVFSIIIPNSHYIFKAVRWVAWWPMCYSCSGEDWASEGWKEWAKSHRHRSTSTELLLPGKCHATWASEMCLLLVFRGRCFSLARMKTLGCSNVLLQWNKAVHKTSLHCPRSCGYHLCMPSTWRLWQFWNDLCPKSVVC